MCTGCSLCWDFCPRGGLAYETTWHGAVPSDAGPRATERAGEAEGPGLGTVVSVHSARVRAGEPERAARAQDGGVVTALLLAALDAGEIDGALVARADGSSMLRAEAHVATTREEILQSAGSFYNQTMALAALDLDRVDLGGSARIALVGTPCAIQGIRALRSREWPRGRSRVERVVLTVALFCSKSFDHRRLVLEELRDARGVDPSRIGRVDVAHGRLLVFDLGGAPLVDEPVSAFRGAALPGCDECADFTGRAADLSVGSVGSPDGWSSVIVRTDAGERALRRAAPSLEIGPVVSPADIERLDRRNRRVAESGLRRPLDPSGPMFLAFTGHVAAYEGTDRAPVWRGR